MAASVLSTPRYGRSREASIVAGTQLRSNIASVMSSENQNQAHPSGALSARGTSSTALRRAEGSGYAPSSSSRKGDSPGRAISKREFQRKQKSKEHALKHDKLMELRERDEVRIKEHALRNAQLRDTKFQEMLEDIRSNDSVRVEVSKTVQQHENEQEKKRRAIYQQFDQEVTQRVEFQLSKFMTRKDPSPRDQLPFREELLRTDDPVKRCLHDQRAEESFRRLADSIIQGGSSYLANAGLAEQMKHRDVIEATVANRASSRPVLPVEQWGQQELFAGPYGHFAQRCERMDAGEPFHSARRMGPDAHLPSESDGIEAAGKKRVKTRIHTQYNHLGVLLGNHAKEGESARHKRFDGAGSGAPLQDHYRYDKGNDIVEIEFPVGKRCFPHLTHA